MTKRYLFVLRKAAHSGSYLQDMLDMILTTAAFEQSVSVLLLDAAVFHLKRGQQAGGQGLKDTAATFCVLPVYEVNAIYAETESLQDYGLSCADLLLPVRELPRCALGDFMQQFDVLVAG